MEKGRSRLDNIKELLMQHLADIKKKFEKSQIEAQTKKLTFAQQKIIETAQQKEVHTGEYADGYGEYYDAKYE